MRCAILKVFEHARQVNSYARNCWLKCPPAQPPQLSLSLRQKGHFRGSGATMSPRAASFRDALHPSRINPITRGTRPSVCPLSALSV